jgi:hypothetical protein
MNIFVLDHCPNTSAHMVCDKHAVKMVLETAQMLCSAMSKHGLHAPYKATHKNHPCTLWAGHTNDNFRWLCEHGLSLCETYTDRYGRQHKSQSVIEFCALFAHKLPTGLITDHPQAMPDKYKGECAIEAYRAYYKGEKAYMARWKYTDQPYWW